MNQKLKTILILLFSIIFTLFIAVYQRMTGPSYPVKGKITLGEQDIKYKLIRTYDGSDQAAIQITVNDTSVKGEIRYRRFKSYDSWQTEAMVRTGETLTGYLLHLPPAGKVMYEVTLIKGDQRYALNEQPAVLRYKGKVPASVLFPHIIIIFLAMLFSTFTGLMVLFKGRNTYVYAWITVLSLLVGGMILGPIVQKFSFGAYWTGWPFGTDLTDNKLLLALVVWVIALVVMHRNRAHRILPVIASIVLLIVFLIPHSVKGSEIDFTKEQKTENSR